MAKNYITKETLKRIEDELNYLKTEKRQEITARLKQAISFGDLKENAAYDEARDAQGFLEGKIMELESLIRNSVILEKGNNDAVKIGNVVTIIDKKSKEKDKYTIVSPPEADPINGKISAESPMGIAMSNLKKGDTFKVDIPSGKIEYSILEIE